MDDIQKLRIQLSNLANSNAVNAKLRSLGISFEHSLLGRDRMPEDAFQVVLDLLSYHTLMKLDSAAYFFATLCTEFRLLSPEQIIRLSQAVRDADFLYGSSGAVVCACADMFARNLLPNVAGEFFNEAETTSNKDFGRFGRDVLRRVAMSRR